MKCLTAGSLLQLITVLTVCSGLRQEFTSSYTNFTVIPEVDVVCHTDGECAFFLGSTCKTNPQRDEKRCLCGDTTKPRGGGSCRHSKKGIDADCFADEDCIPGAICKIEQVPKDYTSCQCMECYAEDNYLCVWMESDECAVVMATASGLKSGFLMLFYPLLLFTEILKFIF